MASIVNTFSEVMLILKVPYKIPVERFITGFKAYDLLFENLDAITYAYFVIIELSKNDEFEATMANFGIPFSRLSEEEVGVLDAIV
ncbi:MAG: hypothetical protein QXQ46_01645 [Thermoplasmatales archaeon]